MYHKAKLSFKHYIPEELKEGMLFTMSVSMVRYGIHVEYLHVFELEELPDDPEKFIQQNGYPVHPVIVMPSSENPDAPLLEVADSDSLGWIEAEDHLYPFEVEDMNYILMDYAGDVGIYIEDDKPALEEGLVILTYMDNMYDDEEEEEEEY